MIPGREEVAGLVILNRRVAGLSEASLARFVLRTRLSLGLKGAVHVLVTGSAAMRTLNLRFRRKNQPTDVLSFPAPRHAKGTPFAGEIAISADLAAQNAARIGHSPVAEIKVLVLHGMLHLAGFDHERDNGAMARKEARLRRELRLPSALIERGQNKAKRRSALRSPESRSKTRRPA